MPEKFIYFTQIPSEDGGTIHFYADVREAGDKTVKQKEFMTYNIGNDTLTINAKNIKFTTENFTVDKR